MIVTGTAFATSQSMPSRYRATATIIPGSDIAGAEAGRDEGTIRRNLVTVSTLITTQQVLDRAVADLPGESIGSLREKVTASADPDANLVHVSATDADPVKAATVANAVVDAFLTQQASLQQSRLEDARTRLVEELQRLEAEAGAPAEIEAIQNRIADLVLAQATTGSVFELVEAAEPPSSRTSPRPVLATLLAFAASLFFAVVVALVRDQMTGGVQTARELGALANLPLLGTVPAWRRFRFDTSTSTDAYDTMQAVIGLALPAYRRNIVVLTGVRAGDDKSRFVIALARALQASNRRVLLISADVHDRRLDELLKVADAPGLTDFVANANGGATLEDFIVGLSGADSTGAASSLDVLPSGTDVKESPRLLVAESLASTFDEIRRLDYDYILVDGAPLTRAVEVHLVAQNSDAIILVAPVDHVTRDEVSDAGDVIRHLPATPLGIVVVGDHSEATNLVRPPLVAAPSARHDLAARLPHASRE
ncbi:MAG: hypothetical protein M3N29_02860 [Chloroflexota bacterium]|nr:hypothetical protein [Chloroflexota bacterium]